MLHPVEFVGAGPGAEDLITLRGAALLESADAVLFAGSLVNPALLRRCGPQCDIRDSADMDLTAQVAFMTEAAQAGKRVVRLHTGDPSVYGAIGEQMDALSAQGVPVRVTPGVSSVFAAAATLSCELTRPGISQSVVLTRTPGRTPMPVDEKAAAFARTGATLAFYLSMGNLDDLTQELAEELSPRTPAAVVYRASWPDERVVRGTLADIAEKTREAGIKRQALLLVGEALGINQNADPHAAPGSGKATPSRLYDADFAHGYRNTLPEEAFSGPCAIYAFTDAGLRLAETLRAALPESVVHGPEMRAETSPAQQGSVLPVPSGGLARLVSENWTAFAAHIFIGATGIAVRTIAPLLAGKAVDPAVVVCPETGAFVLPLVSGHLGGANRLARRLARITGGEALASTATDLEQLPAFDEAAAQVEAHVLNPEALRVLNAALLAGSPIEFVGPESVFDAHFAQVPHIRRVDSPTAETPAVFWDCAGAPAANRLIILSRPVVLGVGCRKDVPPATLLMAARDFLLRHGIPVSRVAAVASCDLKAHDPAVQHLAESLGVPLHCLPEKALSAVDVPTPSDTVSRKVGTPSVCEAAAVSTAETLFGSAALLAPKQSLDSLTLALSGPDGLVLPAMPAAVLEGSVTVVGLGSGSSRHLTPEVRRALALCSHIAGYSGYLDLIRPLLHGKTLVETPMRGEVDRCRAALEAARDGHAVCLVCSGDPGVLAMAGLIYELRRHEPALSEVPVAVLPGITAANLAAAALGAPLQNGFSLVSLSDLLVPADEVRRNVAACAQSALPLVLYNPAGRKRRTLMEEALDLLTRVRGPETFAAFVRCAGRPDEQKWIGTLARFPRDRVDMSTLLVVGGPRTVLHHGLMFEERGYAMDKGR